MTDERRFPIFTIIITIISFYGWNFIFRGNVFMLSFGVCVLQLVATFFCLYWVLKAYRGMVNKPRQFWMILGIGVIFYISGSLLSLFNLINQGVVLFKYTQYLFWLLANTTFLAALVYKTKETGIAIKNISYFFNIFVFMVSAASMSIYFLINPIILSSENSLLNTVINMAYPIIDLGILFIITILYYLILHERENSSLLLIITGFAMHVAADSIYAYLLSTGNYYNGNSVDLLWVIAMLLIGFAGIYAKESDKGLKWHIENPFEEKETIFPYTSIVILIFFTINSYNWEFNALSFGLMIIIFMVIGRQLIIMNRNNKLMVEYKYLAHHDPLTGLNNRVSFNNGLASIMEEYKSRRVALLLIDLDRFKVVNDSLGHNIGDYLLTKVAQRFNEILGADVPLFRIGGDEFVLFIPEATECKCAEAADELLNCFTKPFIVKGYEITVTPSIGISIYPEHGDNGEELLKNADAAMYHAKESGKNNYKFYNADLNEALARKMKIENELRKAIERNQFSLYFQPKVELHSKKIIGMEALLRWRHPELGWISPGEFISIAEETGQIVDIGEWVLRSACKQNKLWQDRGFQPLPVSVNVSVRQFEQNDFVLIVEKALQESMLKPEYLELEITESIMQNIRESMEILHSLNNMGIKTSIDDFGTGYSSLHILQKLPIDSIKIDKSFIDEIDNNNRQSMVKTIIDLGLNLNLNVVAEGIETEHQMKVLLENRCTVGQGYLFSKAVTAEEFEDFLIKKDGVQLEKHYDSEEGVS